MTYKSLKDFKLPRQYDGESGSLITDFYLPALSAAVTYDRAVGYFSAQALVEASEGLSALVANGGKMRLIVGAELEEETYQYIKRAHSISAIESILLKPLESTLYSPKTRLGSYRLELLSWLISTRCLSIKCAFRRQGMFHQKIGIITDLHSNKVAFNGSANESKHALLPDLNDEYASIYRSWDEEIYKYYGEPIEQKFNALWRNTSKNNYVVDVPSSVYEKLRETFSSSSPPDIDKERRLISFLLDQSGQSDVPRPPDTIEGEPFTLRKHQKNALDKWKESAFNGILEHATGSGKTITAIWAALKIYESKGRIFLIVGAPYQALATQWIEELKRFNYNAIPCFSSQSVWKEKLSRAVDDFNLGITKIVCCVAVNDTLFSETFQRLLKNVDTELISHCGLFIGDECHHYTGGKVQEHLRLFKMRLGLSATPFGLNPEQNVKIKAVFGNVVHRYSLEEALDDKVLSPYRYAFFVTYLDEDEEAEYLRLSGVIAAIENRRKAGATVDLQQLNSAYVKRSSILASAADKIARFSVMLNDMEPQPLTLAYGGSGYAAATDESHDTKARNISILINCLREHGWRVSPFTAEETPADRKNILAAFRIQEIHCLASIRVLDEGIDIPGCRHAFLLASSRSPRQFIQRRGRVLRRSPGKDFAEIYDFLTLATRKDKASFRSLARSELQRANEFNRLALNGNENRDKIRKIALDWDIDEKELELPEVEFSYE